jgi:hypothetical protein
MEYAKINASKEKANVKESPFLTEFDKTAGAIKAKEEADPIGTADRREQARRDKFDKQWTMKYGDEGWYDDLFHNKADWISNQIAAEDAKIEEKRAAKVAAAKNSK